MEMGTMSVGGEQWAVTQLYPQITQRGLRRNQVVALAPAEPNVYRHRLRGLTGAPAERNVSGNLIRVLGNRFAPLERGVRLEVGGL
jgi:hypothetical protein